MAGLIFIILTLLTSVIVVSKNKRSHFISGFLETLFFIAIPAAGIYCALEHKEIGMRILLGIVAVAIAGYLFVWLGMGFCRLCERINSNVYWADTLQNVICAIFVIGGIALAIWGVIHFPENWLTIASYVVFVPLFLIAFYFSQYHYEI